MDMSSKLTLARKAKQLQQEKRKCAIVARTRGQKLQRLAAGLASPPNVSRASPQKSPPVATQEHGNATQRLVLADMVSTFYTAPPRRRYCATVLRMAMTLATISLPCYVLMRNFMILPSYVTLFNHFRSELQTRTTLLTSVSEIPGMLEEWNRREPEKKQLVEKMGGILAVDAISLRPHVVVTEDGLVEGLVEGTEQVNASEIAEFRKSYARYEAFVKSLKNKTITDSFVYYYQPLASEVPCQTVLLDPSTQGKATAREVDRLGSLASMLEEFGFRVIGFAFDGDITYSRLHRTFFTSYYSQAALNVSFDNYSSSERMAVSDPLHLLKRGRYRLLSSNVHAGFEKTNDSLISVQRIRNNTDLPSLVFSPEKFAKMNDELATQMFSLRTFAKLFEVRDYSALVYFTPLCLLTAALEEEDLTVEQRIFFLEVGFYYMLAYFGMSKDGRGQLKQTKTKKEHDVRPFDRTFTIEYCNTVFSVLCILKNTTGKVALNRIGTNPVEHLFGLVRMRSRSVHTYDKLTKVLSKVELSQRLLSELGVKQQVDQRKSYFAQTVVLNENTTRKSATDARDVAFALHVGLHGFPISVKQLMVWDGFSIFELAGDIISNFRNLIIETELRCHRNAKKRSLSSTTVKITTGTHILPRIIDNTAVQ